MWKMKMIKKRKHEELCRGDIKVEARQNEGEKEVWGREEERRRRRIRMMMMIRRRGAG